MKKAILFLLIIFLTGFLLPGCDGVTPSVPDDNYDQNNTTLDYIKVFPSQAALKVNQSKKFEMKAYNTDDKLIAVDVSEVDWVCVYECPLCGVLWKLSPSDKSLQTTFTPLGIGDYELWAKYEGKWAKANIEAE